MQRTNSSDFASSLIPLEDIPDCFLSKLLECEEYFIRHQIQAIHSNISSFEQLPGKRKKFINGQKDLICKMFVKNFDLRPLGSNQTVTYMKGASPDKIPSSYCKEHSHNYTSGNFYERLQQKRSTWLERANLDGNEIYFSCKNRFNHMVYPDHLLCASQIIGGTTYPGIKKKN